VQRADGSGVVALPGTGSVTPLMGGRFAEVLFTRPIPGSTDNAVEITSAALWDVTTGNVADRMAAGRGSRVSRCRSSSWGRTGC
jgi:hypothetical protein